MDRQKWGAIYAIYTKCIRGLSLSKITVDYFPDYEPNVIITQLGVVDAPRRVLRPMEQYFITKLFGKRSGTIHKYISKHHYRLTKKRDYHYMRIDDYKRFYAFLVSNTKAKIIIVPIAPAGTYLKQRVYNIEEDIKKYNELFHKLASDNPDRVIVADLYNDTDIDSIVLEDGHHLTTEGNGILFECVDGILSGLGGFTC